MVTMIVACITTFVPHNFPCNFTFWRTSVSFIVLEIFSKKLSGDWNSSTFYSTENVLHSLQCHQKVVQRFRRCIQKIRSKYILVKFCLTFFCGESFSRVLHYRMSHFRIDLANPLLHRFGFRIHRFGFRI